MTTVVVCSLLASSAGAKVVYVPALHKKFGILLSPPALALAGQKVSRRSQSGASGTPTCDTSFEPNCASLMTNTGPGPVQHAEQDYLVFWGPSGSFPQSYVTGMQNFLSGLQAGDYSIDNTSATAGNPLSVVQQYYDNSGPGGAKSFIPLAIQNAGSIMDTDPYPANTANGGECTDTYQTYAPTTCITGADIQNEVLNYIASHTQPGGGAYPTGVNAEYFVLTPPGVGSCDGAGAASNTNACAMSQYCAWHTAAPNNTTYANMPYLAGTPCDIGVALNNDGTDSVVGTFSHELAETMTDPLLNAWQGAGGGGDEIGDKCAYQYVVGNQNTLDTTGLPTQSGGTSWYNVTLNGINYLLQEEFDNSANGGTGGCNQWDTQAQPTGSITPPSSPAVGTPASFSLNTSATVAYVTWNFGDGSAPTVGTTSVQHTYQNPGSYTATAVLTDNNGNEVKLTAPVQVGSGGGTGVPVYSSGLGISGTFVAGNTATAVPGSWTNSPSSYQYLWYLCGPTGTGCSTTSDTGSTYPLTTATVGHTLKVGVAGVNAAGPGTAVVSAASPVVTSPILPPSLSVALSTTHPAPNSSYTVRAAGRARSGGIFGPGHNRSEVDLFEQSTSLACGATRRAELLRAAAKKALWIDAWLVAAGPFSLHQTRTAAKGQHESIRFCGYLSRSATLTDKVAATMYTTT